MVYKSGKLRALGAKYIVADEVDESGGKVDMWACSEIPVRDHYPSGRWYWRLSDETLARFIANDYYRHCPEKKDFLFEHVTRYPYEVSWGDGVVPIKF